MAQEFRSKGLAEGDRVLVGVWPSIALYAGLAAIWRCGGVVVFPEPAMGLKGFLHAAASTKPKALLAPLHIRVLSCLFTETRCIPLGLSPEIPVKEGSGGAFPHIDKENTALISFTSGTTGKPKAMARSHGLLLSQHNALRSLIASPVHEVDLVAFPAFVLTCLGYGTTAVLPGWNMKRHDKVSAEEICSYSRRHGVTRMLVPPVIVSTLAGHSVPKMVSRVLTGGGPVYPDVIRKFLAHAKGTGLTVVYGSTEAEPISHIDAKTLTEADWAVSQSGGGLPVGKPVPEIELMLRNEEIIVTGDHVNKGYVDTRRDAETKLTINGRIWHRTGDRGQIDSQGNLWLLGRAMGPVGLHPFAIECAARSWLGVSDAACIVSGAHANLFVAGDSGHEAVWKKNTTAHGTLSVIPVASIPKDRRHRSKPDIAALQAMAARLDR